MKKYNNFIVNIYKKNPPPFKAIAGKAHKKLPQFIQKTINTIRFIFFKKLCNPNDLSILNYSDGPWTKKETTKDLLRIQKYLLSIAKPIKILQIWIGNSSLFESMRP